MKGANRRLVLCAVYIYNHKLSVRNGLQLLLLYFNSHSVGCAKRLKPPTPSMIVPRHPPSPNRQTFRCPYCAASDLTCVALRDHVTASHTSASNPVVIETTLSSQCLCPLFTFFNFIFTQICPICVSMPWGNAQQMSSNFISHLNLRHRFEYDTYVVSTLLHMGGWGVEPCVSSWCVFGNAGL